VILERGEPTGPTVAITGATGFIGRHLCDRFRRLGWQVRALARDTTAYPFAERGVTSYACDLPDRLDERALDSARVVIHAAYVTRHGHLEEARRVNDLGTRQVLSAARRAGVEQLVFISSQSAHDAALSYYGRSKLEMERLFVAPGVPGGLAIRPGLVLGPGQAGLFHRMCETVRGARLVPLFDGGRQPLQTVHVDDLGAAITAAVQQRRAGVFTVAEPEPVGMRGFLELLAARLGRKPRFVSVPLGPALAALRAIELTGLPFPVSSENLLGLKQMRAVDTRADLAALGVSARPAGVSLAEIFPSPP